jgi:S1-C subfamily serine protease
MRAPAIAALALVSAVLGGVAVLLTAAALGWVDREGGGAPVVLSPAAPPAPPNGSAGASGTPRVSSGDGFDPAAIYAERAPGVVTVLAFFGRDLDDAQAGQGSGFVVSDDGVLLTSAHVVTQEARNGARTAADHVFVQFSDGDRVPAEIVGWDDFADIAALRVDPELHDLVELPLGDSAEVVVGEPVAVIGSPFGEEGSLGVGVVAATGRSIGTLATTFRLGGAIQTDAPINRGNSGGPMLDGRGDVIGVNAQIRSTTGTAEGVGFAIPINAAKRSLEDLLAGGRVAYAYVGIMTEDLPRGLARELGLAVERGAMVVEVAAQGPARKAGMRGGNRTVEFGGRTYRVGGDVVLAIGGEEVVNGNDLVRIVSERLRPGQLVEFTVLRGKERVKVPVRLVERPAEPMD